MSGDRSTGGRLAWILWPLLLGWVFLVGRQAYDELTSDYTVTGLFRDYHSPYETAQGAVVDPRPELSLLTELHRRYAPDRPLPAGATPDHPNEWRALLRAFGLRSRPHTAEHWTGAPPRLRMTADGPQLLIGLFGVDPVALIPGVGVVRMPEGTLAPATLDLDLIGAREPPW